MISSPGASTGTTRSATSARSPTSWASRWTAFLFIDDNPVERDRVRQRLPEVEVWGEDPFGLRRRLLDDPRLQIPVITAEAADRTALVKAQLARQQLRAETLGEARYIAVAAGPMPDRAPDAGVARTAAGRGAVPAHHPVQHHGPEILVGRTGGAGRRPRRPPVRGRGLRPPRRSRPGGRRRHRRGRDRGAWRSVAACWAWASNTIPAPCARRGAASLARAHRPDAAQHSGAQHLSRQRIYRSRAGALAVRGSGLKRGRVFVSKCV